MRSYFTYILASKARGTLYFGVTNGLIRRVDQHRSGKGSQFTRRYAVHRLVWFQEYATAAAAIQRGLDGVGLHMDGARRWVAAQATGLRIAVSLAALVFVMLQRYKTPELILWTTVVLLVALFVIQVLASGTDEDEEEIIVVEEVRTD